MPPEIETAAQTSDSATVSGTKTFSIGLRNIL